MKPVHLYVISILSLFVFTAALSHANEQQACDDWNALEEAVETLKEQMGSTVPSYAPNIIGEPTDALAALEDYDKNIKPKLTKLREDFVKKYGDVDTMDDKLSEIIEIDWRSGKHPTTRASQLYENLVSHMDYIAQARVEKTEQLLRDAQQQYDAIMRYPLWVTDEKFDELKELITHAVAFDPTNKDAQEWLKKADQQRAERMAARQKEIDDAKWPGHYANFAGPGNPDALAKAALEWIQADEQAAGRRDRTFAVAVRGDWVSAKKNILGETIQWGLPIWTACYFPEEKDKGECRVFALTILTAEGGKDIEKAPPFTYTWVGNVYWMRIRNVTGSGVIETVRGVGRPSRTADPSARRRRGLFRTLLWLALVGANLLAGFLATSNVMQPKIPQLEGAYRTLIPLRSLLGVVILLIGLFVFLFNLLRLAPLADILPILSAVIAGILLGKEMIVAKAAGTKAEGTVVSVMTTQKEKLEKLEKQQVPIGFACLILGVLHLLVGGWLFF